MGTSVTEMEMELEGLVPSSPAPAAEVTPALNMPAVSPPSVPSTTTRKSKKLIEKQSWMWDDDDLARDRLRQLFTMIDRFEADGDVHGDDGISSTELMHMLVNLGEDVPEGMADEMVDLVDLDNSTEIEFSEFFGVLTGSISLDGAWRKGEQAKETVGGGGRSIREIRSQFDSIDEDKGGSLDQEEVANLAAKMGQGLKKRHLLDAMKAMDPGDTGEVNFESFKNWLIDTKEGRHWSDFLVLPEGAVAAVRHRASAEKLLPPQNGPAEQWQRLSVLLKLLWEATDCWGSPVNLYGLNLGEAKEKDQNRDEGDLLSAEDVELEAKARTCFFHPNMPIRTTWDLVQVVLLLYLLVLVPLRIAFGLDVDFASGAFWLDACVDIYFIADIFMNFRTGFYDARGVLVIKSKFIATQYLKTWFLLDFVTCLPVSYFVMLVRWNTDAAAGGKEVRMFKVLRLLKLGKLLRVARIVRIIDRYQEELRGFMEAFGGIVLSILVFLFCHIIACAWYYTGSFDIEESGTAPGYDGWVKNYFADETCAVDTATPPPPPPPPTNATSTCIESITTQNTRYLTSVYWSMMTISTVGYGDIPVTTNAEKVIATTTMLFGALIFAAITGQLASRFMATMGAEQGFNTRMDEVRQYLRERSVPTQHRRSIENHFQLLWGKAAIYDEDEILSLLPKVLRDPILHTQYTPVLAHSALFAKVAGSNTFSQGSEILALVAQQLTHTVADVGLILIREGEYGSDMYFIAEGDVDVFRKPGAGNGKPAEANLEAITYTSTDIRSKLGLRLGRLGSNAYFGEQAVFSRQRGGLNRGVRTRSVVSRTACHFHVLSKDRLDGLRQQIPALNNAISSVEEYGYGADHDGGNSTQLRSIADGGAAAASGDSKTLHVLATEVRALSTKLDTALSAIAVLSASITSKA